MDFGLNEQQQMLKDFARDFLSQEYSDKKLNEMARDSQGYTPELWNKMSELGWMSLSIPEAYGGIGDFVDLILIFQEIGRSGLISPFFSSVILGASAIIEAGNEEQKQNFLPDIAKGKKIITLALLEKSGGYAPEDINLQATIREDDYILKGRKLFVPDANSADYIICLARTNESTAIEEGLTMFIVDSKSIDIQIKLLETISPDKQCEVIFNNVKVSKNNILGRLNRSWNFIERILAKSNVALCAEMVGGAERVLDLTIAYAKDRTAFGHPIGAYQSIQHHCANMFIDVETARYLTYQAGWRINENLPSEKEVAIAKAWVSEAYRRIVTAAHQVHGAIGFTEDYVLHWYTKRARSQGVSFGDTNYHLSQLAGLSRKSKL